jgi:hypothetical protein
MLSQDARSQARPPAVAGLFYPGAREQLKACVDTLLAEARSQPRSGCRGVIAPHAGYIYSGPVAAEAFAAVRNHKGRVRRAIIVGPAHYASCEGVVAPPQPVFATPLGEVAVDTAAIRSLAGERLVTVDAKPHAPEHALEVELPFMQRIFGPLPIVPLVFGHTNAAVVAGVLERVWDDTTLLVVSSDLSHYESYESARRRDARTAAAIEQCDEASIGPYEACGHLAVRGALIVAKRRGLTVRRVDLRNSGDTAGDRRSVVGYGAWCFDAETA